MTKKKILIVDDEYDITLSFKRFLNYKGFDVDIFYDSVLALSNFKANYYYVALLDVKMANMDGFGLFKEIKKLDSQVKVYFLTASEAYYEQYRKEEFSKLDKDLFIQKPIDGDELLKRIDVR